MSFHNLLNDISQLLLINDFDCFPISFQVHLFSIYISQINSFDTRFKLSNTCVFSKWAALGII